MPNAEKSKRLSFRVCLAVAGAAVVFALLAWVMAGVYIYWNDPKLVSFLAAWIPTVGSIIIAFVPESRMTLAKKLIWRSTVIAVGFIWSMVLWHQQVITELANEKTQEAIVGKAIGASNEHSDSQISSVRTDIGEIKKDVGGLQKNIQATLSQSEKNLTRSITEVGKPVPPQPVRLIASLWSPSMLTDDAVFPLKADSLSSDLDGVFTIEFTFRNISSSAASNTDVWIYICDQCSFASDPVGYDRPQGSADNVRHKMVPLMNPNTTMAITKLQLRTKTLLPSFTIAFKYSCQMCAGDGTARPQLLTINNSIGLNLGKPKREGLSIPN